MKSTLPIYGSFLSRGLISRTCNADQDNPEPPQAVIILLPMYHFVKFLIIVNSISRAFSLVQSMNSRRVSRINSHVQSGSIRGTHCASTSTRPQRRAAARQLSIVNMSDRISVRVEHFPCTDFIITLYSISSLPWTHGRMVCHGIAKDHVLSKLQLPAPPIFECPMPICLSLAYLTNMMGEGHIVKFSQTLNRL